MSRTRYFDGPRPRVFAHRGLAAGVPENTLAAFAAALEVGATHLETDVRSTRDGVAVLAHDADVSRLTGSPAEVADLALAELQDLDLGDGHRFATLGEALERFPSAFFNIDVKDARAVRPTAVAVREADALDRVLVTSFSERRRRDALGVLPGVATSASALPFVLAIVATKLRSRALARRSLRGIDAVQVPTRAAGMRVDDAGTIRRLQAAGCEVHFWTINDPAEMRRLLAAGADGLVTDRADLALAVLAETPPRP